MQEDTKTRRAGSGPEGLQRTKATPQTSVGKWLAPRMAARKPPTTRTGGSGLSSQLIRSLRQEDGCQVWGQALLSHLTGPSNNVLETKDTTSKKLMCR